MKNWFKGWFTTASKKTPEQVEDMLWNRSTAEIAARLLRRAELHRKGGDYLRMCAVLDRVAADNILKLESQDGKCMGAWLERRDLCLRLLREGKN
jgi:hypothetical protein